MINHIQTHITELTCPVCNQTYPIADSFHVRNCKEGMQKAIEEDIEMLRDREQEIDDREQEIENEKRQIAEAKKQSDARMKLVIHRSKEHQQKLLQLTNQLNESEELLEDERKRVMQLTDAKNICYQLAARDSEKRVYVIDIKAKSGDNGGMSQTFTGVIACQKGDLHTYTPLNYVHKHQPNNCKYIYICGINAHACSGIGSLNSLPVFLKTSNTNDDIPNLKREASYLDQLSDTLVSIYIHI
jgi:hypothetical protein